MNGDERTERLRALIESHCKHAPPLEPADGERAWRIGDGRFAIARGSIPGMGIPPALEEELAYIKSRDPMMGHLLKSQAEAICEEVRRYFEGVEDIESAIERHNDRVRENNQEVASSISELEEERLKAITPILQRIDKLAVDLYESRLELANSEGELDAIKENSRVSDGVAARRAGISAVPRLNKWMSWFLTLASFILGMLIGVHIMMTGGLDLAKAVKGDTLSLWKLVVGALVGAVGLGSAKILVGLIAENARGAFDAGHKSWKALLGLGIGIITWLTLVEIVIVRLGLVRANFVSLTLGAMDKQDLFAASWALGCVLSFSVLAATLALHWKLGQVGPLLERVQAERELEREERMPIRRWDQVSELVHKGRRVVGEIEGELAREKEVLKAIDTYFDHEVEVLKRGIAPVKNSMAWVETESLRRQKTCVAVLEDEFARLRMKVADALTSLNLQPVTEATESTSVVYLDEPIGPWQRVRSWFGIG